MILTAKLRNIVAVWFDICSITLPHTCYLLPGFEVELGLGNWRIWYKLTQNKSHIWHWPRLVPEIPHFFAFLISVTVRSYNYSGLHKWLAESHLLCPILNLTHSNLNPSAINSHLSLHNCMNPGKYTLYTCILSPLDSHNGTKKLWNLL